MEKNIIKHRVECTRSGQKNQQLRTATMISIAEQKSEVVNEAPIVEVEDMPF